LWIKQNISNTGNEINSRATSVFQLELFKDSLLQAVELSNTDISLAKESSFSCKTGREKQPSLANNTSSKGC